MKKLSIALILLTVASITPAWGKETGESCFKEFYPLYRQAALYFNPDLNRKQLEDIVESVIFYSYQYNLDARLVMAVIACESSFNPYASSHAGAQGLGQIMPENAEAHNIDAFNPIQNICLTVRLLRTNLDRFKGLPEQTQYEDALAAYNSGYSAVLKYGGIPPYNETYNYVYKVLKLWRKFCGLK
jgi:soluble lytic murein transglycosylase-like protein